MSNEIESRAHKVNRIMRDCLYDEDELSNKEVVPVEPIIVPAITLTYGLHPGRVALHEKEIIECISGFNDEFYHNKGGGMSVVQLAVDPEGTHWGEHPDIECLCVLAIASKHGRWLLPRDLWGGLFGGMPYIVFYLDNTLVDSEIANALREPSRLKSSE